MPQTPDLYVVCKTCGNEVSPYITECPYCGTRLRKRAPKIARDGSVVEPKVARRRAAVPRLPKLRPGEIPGVRADPVGRPWATATLVALSLFGYLLLFVVDRVDIGVVGSIGDEWWRVATAPFLYGNLWYELAAVTAIAVFGWLLERRHGALVVLLLFALCGAGGVALTLVAEDAPLVGGGNGAALGLLCAWAMRDLLASLRGRDHDGDLLGAAVFAGVLLLMPLATTEAHAIAGVGGAVAGALAGTALARARVA